VPLELIMAKTVFWHKSPVLVVTSGTKVAVAAVQEEQINRYQHKISGPLMDRIDMVLSVPPLAKKDLLNQEKTDVESSEVIRPRALKAYNKQIQRQIHI